MNIDFDDLDDFATATVRPGKTGPKRAPAPAAESKTETCPKCSGTGNFVSWSGRIVGDCRTCAGDGNVRPTTLKRHVARQLGEQYKAENRFSRSFAKTVGGEDAARDIVNFLSDAGRWSTFYGSLLNQLSTRGKLSEKQLAAIYSGRAKIAARQAERDAERDADQPAAQDMAALFSAFASAGAKLKFPKLHYTSRRITISKAPDSGKNAGCLYVKHAGEYCGKIDPVKGFSPTRAASAEVIESVRQIALDPAGEMKASGVTTGECGCCARELTDPVSVERGIGPVCAKRWGF